MASQLSIIKSFMKSLKADEIQDTATRLDKAVQMCHSDVYSSMGAVVNDCINSCASSPDYEYFLKTYCDIDLSNGDTGAITGSDAGGLLDRTSRNIVPESFIEDWEMPSVTTEVINGLTINYPALTGLTNAQEFIIGALHTWWIKNSLSVIHDSFGYAFDNSTATPKEITVMFSNEGPGTIAHVDWYWTTSYTTTGECILLNLVINMDMCNNIDTNDVNGAIFSSGDYTHYLDRTIVHEFVHGICAANIRWWADLESDCEWFSEGLAELVHGIDDKRHTELVATASDYTLLSAGLSGATGGNSYTSGYILLRFFTKQMAKDDVDGVGDAPPDVSDRMHERGIVLNFTELGLRFLEFAQRSEGNVQAWELERNKLNTFYGATLKIPMKDWARGNKCPYFYVTLSQQTITSSTYADWLRTGIMLNEYIGKDHTDIYSDWHTRVYPLSEAYDHSRELPTSTRHVVGKYGSTDRENAFRNTGEFLAVGVHTLYDESLAMCEQGGVTCKKEATAQINDLNLLPWRSWIQPWQGDAQESSKVQLPVYPGTGCPWFTISDDNRSEYDIDNNGITYWFTKQNYCATITIRFRGGDNPDVYQSISFGRMSIVDDDSYLFPLYCAGGNQALSNDVYVYVPIQGQNPTYADGNIYDLDILNPAQSNANLLNPTKFNKANMSNFRIMSPEGEWKDIYAKSQDTQVLPYFVCDGPVPNWATLLKDVVWDGGEKYHSAYLFLANNEKMTDTYRVRKEETPYESSSRLERIAVVLKQDLPHNETGIMGVLPNVYASWSRTLPCGEITIAGKKYLSVPNGWQDRLTYYPASVGLHNDPSYWDAKQLRQKFDDLWRKRSVHRLLIPLEGGV